MMEQDYRNARASVCEAATAYKLLCERRGPLIVAVLIRGQRGARLKPCAFEYRAPATLGEAIDLLASDPEAMVIAGGQSLMPVLAFRLAAPSMLVDLRRVPGLGNIDIGDAGVRLGSRVRWRDIEDDSRLEIALPLLREATSHVAHYGIRNRGTVGGSLAHADPAAELPGIAVTCEAEITLVGAAGTRQIAASDFFTGPLSTLRRPDEIVTELRLPYWPEGRRWAFQEFAQRHGDFALAGIALFYDEDRAGRVRDAHAGVIGACDQPHRLPEVETVLNGRSVDENLIREAASGAAKAVDPPADVHAGAAYRRALVATLVERGLRVAAARGR
jgi:aerobic carbon-monoxide dehydrogenase medium subunit